MYDINRFHFVAFIAWHFSNLHCAQVLLPIYTNYVPKWRCGSNGTMGRDCVEYTSCNETIEFDDVAFRSAALEFNWICDRHYYATLLSQIQFVGVLAGSLTFGTASDIFGRRPTALCIFILGISTTILSGLAINEVLYYVARFLVGLTIGGTYVAVYTYINELILPQQRMFLRAVFNWGLARLLLALVCFAMHEWRYATIAMSSASFIVLFIVIVYLPESPTWLLSQGRNSDVVQSEKTMAKLAGITYVRQEHKKAVKPKTMRELLQHRETLNILAVHWVMWFTVAVCGYAIDLNSNTISGNLYINQIIIAAMIYVSKSALLYVDTRYAWFTRRVFHQSAQSGIIICFSTLYALTYFRYQGVLYLIFTVLGTVLIEYTWDVCCLCTVEALETSARASGTGSCSFIARAGGVLSPMIASANHFYPGVMYLAVVGMGIICLTVSCAFLGETKGIALDRAEYTEEEEEEKRY